MARSRFTARHGWGRWVGSVEDVVAVSQLASRLITERGVNAHHEITVEQPGLTLEYDDPQEFADQTTTDDLPQIRVVAVSVVERDGEDERDPLSIAVVFGPRVSLGQAVRLRVAGADRTVVEGLRTRLVERLNQGARFPHTSGRVLAAVTAIGVVIIAALLVVSGALDEALEPLFDLPRGVDIAVWLGGWLLIISLVSLPWAILFPGFEWLAEGDRPTRWDRWRKWTWSALGALILIVVAALVGDLIG